MAKSLCTRFVIGSESSDGSRLPQHVADDRPRGIEITVYHVTPDPESDFRGKVCEAGKICRRHVYCVIEVIFDNFFGCVYSSLV